MPYAIMQSIEGRSTDREWEPTDLIFDTGGEAGDWVKNENVYASQIGSNRRYKALRISEDDPMAWRQRECSRLENGVYQKVPWSDTYSWRASGMYEHIDPEDGTKVRFTACPTDGMQGKYTSMTPGRFIRKYIDSDPNFRNLDTWCAQMGLDLTTSPLLIATSAEDIVRVYTEGPHSCMAYKIENGMHGAPSPFRFHTTHPVSVYGDSDIGVAYIERRGEITARCLIRNDKKIHGRIYGDSHRLLERLRENGYIEDWDGFVGAKIRQIYNEIDGRDSLVLPYVDGDFSGVVKDGLDWLVLSEQPNIIAKSPYGIPLTDECQRCGAKETPLTKYTGEDDDYDEPEYICAEGCKF